MANLVLNFYFCPALKKAIADRDAKQLTGNVTDKTVLTWVDSG